MSNQEFGIVVGVCREDNPRDVDEAYGAGTYARLFELDENESCSTVLRADWPTRQNDQTCSQKALAVCQGEGCEAPLCAVHMEICPKCGAELCEGCLEGHEEVRCG